MSSAITEFNRGEYDLLIASGGPLDQGSLITGADTYAELAYKSLLELGMNSNSLASAPAPDVLRNRTFVSAVSVQNLLSHSKNSWMASISSPSAHTPADPIRSTKRSSNNPAPSESSPSPRTAMIPNAGGNPAMASRLPFPKPRAGSMKPA